jgi:two-component system, LuxR family, response regulator FixJ
MKTRVLVFDDDPAVCAILQFLLERYGCEVATYANPTLCPLIAPGATRCGAGESYADLIISDLEMPEMSGLELVSHLDRNGWKLPPVLLISGMWSRREVAAARRMDCHVLNKPFTVGTLYAWVDECMRTVDPNRSLCRPSPETARSDDAGF